MSHIHYCDFTGHQWECEGTALRPLTGNTEPSVCMCQVCEVPMEDGDHSGCRRACRALTACAVVTLPLRLAGCLGNASRKVSAPHSTVNFLLERVYDWADANDVWLGI